jgi:hypothetical protein
VACSCEYDDEPPGSGAADCELSLVKNAKEQCRT